MVLQPPQTRVCSSSQSLEASSGEAQLEADIAPPMEALRQQRQQIRMAAGLLAQRLAVTAGHQGLRC
jgi:uncharacterized protein involved in exopolysaccharide biosynthesis